MTHFTIARNLGLSLCFIIGIGISEVYCQNAPVAFDRNSDSLLYNAPLPIFRDVLNKSGLAFPQPFGATVKLYYGNQELEISNFKLGVNGGGLTGLDGLMESDTYSETAQTVSFQADAWVLPFLNVFGIVGFTNIDSEIKFSAPIDYNLEISNKGSFVGYGATLASVLGPVFISADAQIVHTFSENQDHSDINLSSGLRVGPSFDFKNKPKRNLVVYVGALYTNYINTSSGTYDAIDLFPQAQDNIDREIDNLDTWYNSLSKSDQAQYQDKYQGVREILSGVSANVDDAKIDYKVDKRLEMPWNMVIGAQYQLNPKLLVKGEFQMLGSRNAFLATLNYRFGNKN